MFKDAAGRTREVEHDMSTELDQDNAVARRRIGWRTPEDWHGERRRLLGEIDRLDRLVSDLLENRYCTSEVERELAQNRLLAAFEEYRVLRERHQLKIEDKERSRRILSERVEDLESQMIEMARHATEARAAARAARDACDSRWFEKMRHALDRIAHAEREWEIERQRLRQEIRKLQNNGSVFGGIAS
jgi:hypothetical protein